MPGFHSQCVNISCAPRAAVRTLLPDHLAPQCLIRCKYTYFIKKNKKNEIKNRNPNHQGENTTGRTGQSTPIPIPKRQRVHQGRPAHRGNGLRQQKAERSNTHCPAINKAPQPQKGCGAYSLSHFPLMRNLHPQHLASRAALR